MMSCNDVSTEAGSCKCRKLATRVVDNGYQRTPVCSPWELKACQQANQDDEKETCIKKCLNPCTQDKLEVTFTSALFDIEAVAIFMKDIEPNVTNFIKNYAVARIAYETLEYTEIKHVVAMSFGTLMSNFGGLFG